MKNEEFGEGTLSIDGHEDVVEPVGERMTPSVLQVQGHRNATR